MKKNVKNILCGVILILIGLLIACNELKITNINIFSTFKKNKICTIIITVFKKLTPYLPLQSLHLMVISFTLSSFL